MKRLLYILGALLLITAGAFGQTVINCSGWVLESSGACGVAENGYIDAGEPWNYRGSSYPATLDGSNGLILVPTGGGHSAWSLVSQNPYNVMAFTETMEFYWNGSNITMMWQNNNSSSACPGSACLNLTGGAGGEGGCNQTYVSGTVANGLTLTACLFLDGYSGLNNGSSFTGSTIALYQPWQATYLPLVNSSGYIAEFNRTKTLTSPVQLNNPSTTAGAPNTDLFKLTTTYDHGTGTLVAQLYDETAGGSCPGASCFTFTLNGVWLPEIVGATTSYPTITGGSSGTPTTTAPLTVKSLVYTINTPSSPSYSFAAWNAGSTFNDGSVSAATPVMSVAPGTVTSGTTVTITTSTTPNNYICYEYVSSITTSTLFPQVDNNGGCAVGTKYTGAITITSSGTLLAMAGPDNFSFTSGGPINPTGLGSPSLISAAAYTIGSGTTPPTQPTPIIISKIGDVQQGKAQFLLTSK